LHFPEPHRLTHTKDDRPSTRINGAAGPSHSARTTAGAGRQVVGAERQGLGQRQTTGRGSKHSKSRCSSVYQIVILHGTFVDNNRAVYPLFCGTALTKGAEAPWTPVAAGGSFRALWSGGTVAGLSDGELMEQFLLRRDEASDIAFEALMRRHGPMVFPTCRRALRGAHDVVVILIKSVVRVFTGAFQLSPTTAATTTRST
jgi:hypothetical protein